MVVSAGIVLYNPDYVRLKENIGAIAPQVEKVIIVDNGSLNYEEVAPLFNDENKFKVVKNEKNLGIATALNQILNTAHNLKSDWVLTLDQDSVCQDDIIKKYLSFIEKKDVEKIGCLTCNIVDRNFNKNYNFKGKTYKEVKICITSAALMNTKATLDVGGFDNSMFIDKVDFDICINLRKHSYKIIHVDFDGILHELGNSTVVNFGFFKIFPHNHSAFRRYYICKNGVYLFKKYKTFETFKMCIHDVLGIIKVFIFEKEKFSKLQKSIQGIFDGWRK